eukprot:TRINITY_DN8890_c0_g1_i2.p1 TRINITY_DN8890_c0_g1~~TRINITY_DN8890_c0_g1_i2.p1  ORF type:complete len:768 (+),score=99.80 TRINITY_DN8890_c0_g1_i2:115-2304(+)
MARIAVEPLLDRSVERCLDLDEVDAPAQAQVMEESPGDAAAHMPVVPVAWGPFVDNFGKTAAATGEDMYEPVPFTESTWNVIVVLGFAQASRLDVAIALLLVCLSASMQIVFASIALSPSFLGARFKDLVNPAKSWRLNTAHDHTFLDLAGVSLAGRVCSGDSSLVYSNEQLSILTRINQYLQLEWEPTSENFMVPSPLPPGPILCMLCISLWVLYVCCELRSTFMCVEALAYVRRGEVTAIVSRTLLTAISRSRLGALYGVNALRVCICLALLVSGTQWLSQTTSIQDLILNSVALGALLDVDRIIFAGMMPVRMQTAVTDLEAIPVKYTRKRSSAEAAIVLVFTGAVAILSYIFLVNPLCEGMLAVKKQMCGGNTDFVVAHNLQTDLFEGMFSNNFSSSADLTLLNLAVQDATVFSRDPLDAKYITFHSQQSIFDLWRSRDVESVTTDPLSSNHCSDFDAMLYANADTTPWSRRLRIMFNLVKDRLGRAQAAGCADLREFCGMKESNLLRYLCPVTCGCSSPYTDIIWRVPRHGCTPGCLSKAEEVISEYACRDTTIALGILNETMHQWFHWSLLELGLDADHTLSHQIRSGYVDTFEKYGCAALDWRPRDPFTNHLFCEGGPMLPPLAHDPDNIGCPKSCTSCKDDPQVAVSAFVSRMLEKHIVQALAAFARAKTRSHTFLQIYLFRIVPMPRQQGCVKLTQSSCPFIVPQHANFVFRRLMPVAPT